MLEGHVTVVRDIPEMVMERFGYDISNVPNLKVKAWASSSYYSDVAVPLLREHGYVSLLLPYLEYNFLFCYELCLHWVFSF